jgi:hypothetical protein
MRSFERLVSHCVDRPGYQKAYLHSALGRIESQTPGETRPDQTRPDQPGGVAEGVWAWSVGSCAWVSEGLCDR